MKKISLIAFLTILSSLCLNPAFGVDAPKIGVVNFKECVEKSKHGQQEKVAFESLKNQMMETLEKADKELLQIAEKLEDQDFMDGLSPTAEEELKIKYQQMSQELARCQNQYYQMLNQANYRMLQTLHTFVAEAADKIREQKGLMAVFNQDSFFAFADHLDITSDIVAAMNDDFEKENVSDITNKVAGT